MYRYVRNSNFLNIRFKTLRHTIETNIVINITNVTLTYTHKATKQKQTITSNYITN